MDLQLECIRVVTIHWQGAGEAQRRSSSHLHPTNSIQHACDVTVWLSWHVQYVPSTCVINAMIPCPAVYSPARFTVLQDLQHCTSSESGQEPTSQTISYILLCWLYMPAGCDVLLACSCPGCALLQPPQATADPTACGPAASEPTSVLFPSVSLRSSNSMPVGVRCTPVPTSLSSLQHMNNSNEAVAST